MRTFPQFCSRLLVLCLALHSTASANIGNPAANPETLVEEKLRHNFADSKVGAKVLAAHPEASQPQNMLSGDRDQYYLSPCHAPRKWLIIELAEENRMSTFGFANYEFYSSSLRDFTLLGATQYPCHAERGCLWQVLGNFTAENNHRMQYFDLPERSVVRYLKLLLLTHYGAEPYCTVSQIRVHGSNFIDDFRSNPEVWDSPNEDVMLEVEVDPVLSSEVMPTATPVAPPSADVASTTRLTLATEGILHRLQQLLQDSESDGGKTSQMPTAPACPCFAGTVPIRQSPSVSPGAIMGASPGRYRPVNAAQLNASQTVVLRSSPVNISSNETRAMFSPLLRTHATAQCDCQEEMVNQSNSNAEKTNEDLNQVKGNHSIPEHCPPVFANPGQGPWLRLIGHAVPNFSSCPPLPTVSVISRLHSELQGKFSSRRVLAQKTLDHLRCPSRQSDLTPAPCVALPPLAVLPQQADAWRFKHMVLVPLPKHVSSVITTAHRYSISVPSGVWHNPQDVQDIDLVAHWITTVAFCPVFTILNKPGCPPLLRKDPGLLPREDLWHSLFPLIHQNLTCIRWIGDEFETGGPCATSLLCPLNNVPDFLSPSMALYFTGNSSYIVSVQEKGHPRSKLVPQQPMLSAHFAPPVPVRVNVTQAWPNSTSEGWCTVRAVHTAPAMQSAPQTAQAPAPRAPETTSVSGGGKYDMLRLMASKIKAVESGEKENNARVAELQARLTAATLANAELKAELAQMREILSQVINVLESRPKTTHSSQPNDLHGLQHRVDMSWERLRNVGEKIQIHDGLLREHEEILRAQPAWWLQFLANLFLSCILSLPVRFIFLTESRDGDSTKGSPRTTQSDYEVPSRLKRARESFSGATKRFRAALIERPSTSVESLDLTEFHLPVHSDGENEFATALVSEAELSSSGTSDELSAQDGVETARILTGNVVHGWHPLGS
eukprot:TRINITY_DN5613_c0_g1_i1.p1 TRINITY_DN5613_c0_g1~~TRINITY_DN5613_c0_g1_i1.p1  ORF type:complete len:948 (+),score=83.60 TRINITY_DN5613_c0_g1_i1:23-2866(+)